MAPSSFRGTKPSTGLDLEFPQSLAVYDTYEQAQRAVDHLSDEAFPVENLLIVGTDLKRVERVTGRLTWGRVAAAGAITGLWFGDLRRSGPVPRGPTASCWRILLSTAFSGARSRRRVRGGSRHARPARLSSVTAAGDPRRGRPVDRQHREADRVTTVELGLTSPTAPPLTTSVAAWPSTAASCLTRPIAGAA